MNVNKALGLSIAGLLVSLAAPADAATSTSVTFLPGQTTLPGYTTATVIQSFSATRLTTFSDAAFPVPGYTQKVDGTGVANVRATAIAGSVGAYLDLRARPTTRAASTESYTLSIAGSTPALHFVAFLISNFVSATDNSVVLKYADGTSSGNVLAALTPGATGQVVINRSAGPGITSIIFASFGAARTATANHALVIDEIAGAAPEPATWGMMLLGFGIAGSVLRRKRKAAAA